MIERQFSLAATPAVDIDVRTADVVVDRGPAGAVTVQIDAKNEADWHVTQHGDGISVRDERTGWRSRGGGRVRLTVPDGTAARITTASGDVSISVTTGRTQITTASGDVRVAIATALTVKTASGDVVVDRVAHDTSVKSASGDLKATEVGGALDATTASGDIRIDRITGDVRASTASGDIRVTVFSGEQFLANTVSGDVSLGIPAGRRVDLDVNTLTGDVVLPERRTAPAAAPTGSVSIRVKSVSGDFRLQRA